MSFYALYNYKFSELENRNVVVDFGSVSLRNAFSNPYNISAFLFLQLYISVEYSKMELVIEGKHIQFYLRKKYEVLKILY